MVQAKKFIISTFHPNLKSKDFEFFSKQKVVVEFTSDKAKFSEFLAFSGEKLWSIRNEGFLNLKNFKILKDQKLLFDCPIELISKIPKELHSNCLLSFHGKFHQIPKIKEQNFWGLKLAVQLQDPFDDYEKFLSLFKKYPFQNRCFIPLNETSQSIRLHISPFNTFNFGRRNLETASYPAQPKIEDLIHFEKTKHIKVRSAFVGSPKASDHSYSPRFHRKYLPCYDRLEFSSEKDFLKFFKKFPYQNLSITHPFKETLIKNEIFNTYSNNQCFNTDIVALEEIISSFKAPHLILGSGKLAQMVKQIHPNAYVLNQHNINIFPKASTVINTWPPEYIPNANFEELRKIPVKWDVHYGIRHLEVEKKFGFKFMSGLNLFLGQACLQKQIFSGSLEVPLEKF